MSDKQIWSIINRVPVNDPKYDELINVIIPSLRESENNKWTCPYCSRNAHFNANYSSYFAFTRHLAQRHRDCLPLDGDIFGFVSSFKCEVCNKDFSRNDHYKSHLKSKTHIQNELIKKQNETNVDRDMSSDEEENERLIDLLKERGKRARNLQQSEQTLKFEPENFESESESDLLRGSSKRRRYDKVKNPAALSPLTPEQSNLHNSNQQASQSSKRRRNYEYDKNCEINSPVDEDFSLPNLDYSIQSTPISNCSAKKLCFNKPSNAFNYEQDEDILEAINAYYYSDESNDPIPSAQISKYEVSKRSSYFEEYEKQNDNFSTCDSIKQEITSEQPNRDSKRKKELVEYDDDDDDQMLANFISQYEDEQLRAHEPILKKDNKNEDEDEEEDHLLNSWISQNVIKFKYLQPVRSNNNSNNNVDSDELKKNQSKSNNKRVRFE